MLSTQLNDLSCIACKARKVRCSRVKPRCDRCETRGIDCCYPKRVKRQSAHEKRGITRNNTVLSTILGRLQRLEEQSTNNNFHDAPEPTAPSASAASTTPSSHFDSDNSPISISSVTRADPLKILEDAIDQMRRLKLQFYSRQVITGTIHIPTDLAKEWLHNYFARTSNNLFRSLINRQLIEMMPDIIDLPHVHLDPVVLILYFAILYIGCVFNANNLHASQVSHYATSCYLACLRALPYWQREVQGSTMDFVAALFMVSICALGCGFHADSVLSRVKAQVALLCSDDDLAWQMHQHTCDFARALGLHNIDRGDYAGFRDEARSDEDREGFWQLIQIDLVVRLVLNKPPLITADTWKVNLPWLNSSQPPADIHATTFIIHSRVTLIVMHFFGILDEAGMGDGELQRCTEELCHEIKDLLLDWQARDWLLAPSAHKGEEFTKTDVVITGYTFIIFMLRKVGIIGPHLTKSTTGTPGLLSPLALEASRRVIEISIELCNMFPYPEGLSMVLVYYRPDIATALLYSHVLHSTDDPGIVEDMGRLGKLSKCVCFISHGCRELAPIGRAMETLNRMMTDQGLSA